MENANKSLQRKLSKTKHVFTVLRHHMLKEKQSLLEQNWIRLDRLMKRKSLLINRIQNFDLTSIDSNPGNSEIPELVKEIMQIDEENKILLQEKMVQVQQQISKIQGSLRTTAYLRTPDQSTGNLETII